jgi:hypothetical protein
LRPRPSADADQSRLVVWRVIETAGFESTWLDLRGMTLRASGRVVGQTPRPYWLDYTLETDSKAATTRLAVDAEFSGGERHIDLRRDGGGWTVDGTPRPDLDAALDCDLGFSPLTNTMPVIRHGLHLGPGTREFTMAFVEVPTLRAIPMRQTYRHLSSVPGGPRIRYSSGTFASDLLVGVDGIVVDYPQLGYRIDPQRTPPGA